MRLEYKLENGDFSKAGNVASDFKKILKQLCIDPKIIKRNVIVSYEAAVNIVAHAYKGIITAEINDINIIMQFNDEGPGIDDINKAMQEGYSTASPKVREMGFGAGMGLANIKKNSDYFNISSIPKKGTSLEIINDLVKRKGAENESK